MISTLFDGADLAPGELMRTSVLLLLATLLTPATALAHARLVSPTPRNTRDDVKDGTGAPCGGARSTNVHAFHAGSTLKVDWEETVNHDGHFEILFSNASDQGFAFLKDASGKTLDNVAHSN